MIIIEEKVQWYIVSVFAFLSISSSVAIWMAFHPNNSHTNTDTKVQYTHATTPSYTQSSQKPLCKDCNVIIMTLDSCSAKNIQCYGYDRATMPNLCKFASEHLLFTNSFSNATWTLPSHVSLMTGLLPSHHQIDDEWQDALDKKVPLLPEVLQQHGYETILYQDRNAGILPIDLVYNRGITEIDGQYTIGKLFRRLELNASQGKKTFFTYYNSICHEPNRIGYGPKIFTTDSYPEIPVGPENNDISFTKEFFEFLKKNLPKILKTNAYGTATASIRSLFDRMEKSRSFEEAKSLFLDNKNFPDLSIRGQMYWDYIYSSYINVRDKKMMAYLKALYDQQLLELDANEIAEFVTKYNTSDLKDRTIVIISAEHGQEFGEHGVFGHSTLYEPNIRVPLIMSIPGQSPQVITNPVQIVDIMPTILDLVGVTNTIEFDGKSIVPAVIGDQFPERMLIAEWAAGVTKTIRKGDWKLFMKLKDGEYIPYELYNLKNDPDESINLLVPNLQLVYSIIRDAKAAKLLK